MFLMRLSHRQYREAHSLFRFYQEFLSKNLLLVLTLLYIIHFLELFLLIYQQNYENPVVACEVAPTGQKYFLLSC